MTYLIINYSGVYYSQTFMCISIVNKKIFYCSKKGTIAFRGEKVANKNKQKIKQGWPFSNGKWSKDKNIWKMYKIKSLRLVVILRKQTFLNLSLLQPLPPTNYYNASYRTYQAESVSRYLIMQNTYIYIYYRNA
jgi:hypothetical protein